MRTRLSACVVLSCWFLLAWPVQAAIITTTIPITDGTVVFSGSLLSNPSVHWSLTGPDFVGTGPGEGTVSVCDSCAPGSFPLRASVSAPSPFGSAGIVTYLGVTYTALGPTLHDFFIGGPFFAFAGTALIPNVDVPSLDVTGTFTMTGGIDLQDLFFVTPTSPEPTDYHITFVGQGVVTHHLVRHSSPPGTIVYDDDFQPIIYQFTAPVPEPATWLLLVTGLAGLVSWRRQRRIVNSQ